MKNHIYVTHPRDVIKKEQSNIAAFNTRVAKALGAVLGSMYFFYFCILLDLAELPSVISAHSVIAWITYIAQTVIQLVALPVLQVYQNIQQSQNEAKADVDHEALSFLANISDDQMKELKLQTSMLESLKQISEQLLYDTHGSAGDSKYQENRKDDH